MHPALVRYMGKTPTVCATCRRRAAGFGYTPRPHAISNAIWLCGSNTAIAQRRGSTPCRHEQFDEYELGAMLEAGRNAGRYLDEIGKTDLKLLSATNGANSCSRLLTGYEHALRRKLLNNEPPFDSPPSYEDAHGSFRNARRSLIERGYAAIPIMPDSKIPGYFCAGMWVLLPGWQQRYLDGRKPQLMDLAAWGSGDTGLGVVGGRASHGLIGDRHRHRRCRDQERDRQGVAADAGDEDAARKARPDFSTAPISRPRRAGTSTASGSAT